MKTSKYAIFCAAALLLLTACGGSDSGASGGAVTENSTAAVQAEGGASGETGNASGGGTDSASNADTAAKSDGYTFASGNAVVVIDAEAAPILSALGEADSYYEAASCAFEGLDKYYTYSSFEVDTYPDENGVDRISAVLLKDDLVSTAEGVSIGDSAEAVAAAYGQGDADSASAVYEKGGMKLMFIFDGDGAVESIQYLTKALDAVTAETEAG